MEEKDFILVDVKENTEEDALRKRIEQKTTLLNKNDFNLMDMMEVLREEDLI